MTKHFTNTMLHSEKECFIRRNALTETGGIASHSGFGRYQCGGMLE